MIDVLGFDVREIAVAKDPDCPVCGTGPKPKHLPVEEAREVTVSDLRQRLADDPPVLLDVREPAEREAGHIGGRHIPLGELDDRLAELTDVDGREIVAYCKSGARSARAASLLRDKGFRVASLRGGIEAWNAQP